MRYHVKIIALIAIVTYVLIGLNGCETSLKAKFAPLHPLPPGPITKQANDIVVLSGLPPVGKQYIELGYIKVNEGDVGDLFTMFISDGDIINMVRAKAAEVGADAVINFKLTGTQADSDRKAEGTAIKYEKTSQE